jgi:two-component system chemotaxis sensor kinase CheA
MGKTFEKTGKRSKKTGGASPKVQQPERSPIPSLQIESLNDAAAALIQLSQFDIAELKQLRDALSSIPEAASSHEHIRKLIHDAARHIDQVIKGDSANPNNVILDAGNLLEKAIYAFEDAVVQERAAAAKAAREAREAAEAAARDASLQSAMEAETPDAAAALLTEPQNLTLLPDEADADLIGEFITESLELISGIEAALLNLEADPDSVEAVNQVFRAFHTIKGTSGFLGVKPISELSHRAESLLSRVREHEIRCTGGYADLALKSADVLKKLVQLLQDELRGVHHQIPAEYPDLLRVLGNPEAAGISAEHQESVETSMRIGDILVATGKVSREAVEDIVAEKGSQPIGVALLKTQAASLPEVAEALRVQQRITGTARSMESSVRVRTDRLDRLIDMIGELVIAQSIIAGDRTLADSAHHEFQKKVSHAGKIVRELHDLSMSIRMVPLKAMFQKMVRLVRDLSQKSGKTVVFETEGEDTEIDRNMVDVISDPLVHMVRNAVDHGIEAPEERAAYGKPKTGVIRLHAYHSGGNVVVELTDDGRGLDRDKILEKAFAKGLVDEDKTLSDQEIYNLIFLPGFSTAEKITEVSGRGVGMDVVRRNVDALRGQVEIDSEQGKGCTFTVRLPLTLAITDGMLVKVGRERYIVPTVNIFLSFRPEPGSLSTVVGKGLLVRLRDELMPVFCLYRLFGVKGAIEDPLRGLLVVVGDGTRRCAILVDELYGQQQVVAKSLGSGIGKIHGVSGGAILGDGRVGLILDPGEIASLARGSFHGGDGHTAALQYAAARVSSYDRPAAENTSSQRVH